MRYDKENRKVDRLNNQLKELKTQNEAIKAEARSTQEILNSTLHEIRRFSAQLSKFCERISRETRDNQNLNQLALSAFYTAGMISSRLAYTDIELNPRAIESQTSLRSGIFKKFDKAKRILAEEARGRDVTVQLIGESRAEIEALPILELLPFVVLENAIKYSPPSQTVTVQFETIPGRQVVTIKSHGPEVAPDELPKLFDKGFRGASTIAMPGEGLGLFLAKRVCDLHGFSIAADIEDRSRYSLNGVNYSEFIVKIIF